MDVTPQDEAGDLLVLDEEEGLFDLDELIDFSHDELEDLDEPMSEEETGFLDRGDDDSAITVTINTLYSADAPIPRMFSSHLVL